MGRNLSTIILLLTLLNQGLNGQDAGRVSLQAAELPADSAVLEEVSISVLPFSGKHLEAAGAVYTSRPEEIKREFGLVSTGLYNSAPGVFMASGALNTHRVTIRGIGSRTPYNSNRIRAYLDDIPLTSGDGISTLEDQDLLAIGSMEVLKGPSSAVYGAGLGGVVRLNSPYPRNPGWMTSVLAEAGSFGSQRYALTGQVKKGSLAMSGGFSRTSTDGYRENSDYLRNSGFLHAQVFGRKHRLKLTFSLTDLRSGIPSSLNQEDFENNPEKAGGTWGITGGFEEYIKVLGGARLESDLGPRLKNRLILAASYSDPYERRPFNILDEQSSNFSIIESLEYDLGGLKLGGGLEYFHEFFDWRTYETLAETQGSLLSDQHETRKFLNVFATAQWKPSENLIINAGLNLNVLTYSLITNYRSDSSDQSGSYRYSPVLSPRLGISYMHQFNIHSYASAGHGFSAPSLEETLLPEGMVNTSLRPETGWNFDIGNRGIMADGRLEYDVTFYTILLEDLLVTERLAEDVFTGVNAGSAWFRGMELMLRGQLMRTHEPGDYNAGLRLSYQLSKNTFTDFVDEGVDYGSKELPGIPGQILRTEANGVWKGFTLLVQYNFTGQQWMNDANDERYESFGLLHMRAEWQKSFGSSPITIRFYGGIRNLFDRHHASMILINAPSFGGSAPRYYYPGIPRYFFLGMVVSIS